MGINVTRIRDISRTMRLFGVNLRDIVEKLPDFVSAKNVESLKKVEKEMGALVEDVRRLQNLINDELYMEADDILQLLIGRFTVNMEVYMEVIEGEQGLANKFPFGDLYSIGKKLENRILEYKKSR